MDHDSGATVLGFLTLKLNQVKANPAERHQSAIVLRIWIDGVVIVDLSNLVQPGRSVGIRQLKLVVRTLSTRQTRDFPDQFPVMAESFRVLRNVVDNNVMVTGFEAVILRSFLGANHGRGLSLWLEFTLPD